jgi:cation transport ATPase
MAGGGINDALILVRVDIGIAMNIRADVGINCAQLMSVKGAPPGMATAQALLGATVA